MSIWAWFGLVWMYLVFFFTLLGIFFEVVGHFGPEPRIKHKAIKDLLVGVVCALALVALWSVSTAPSANLLLGILLGIQVIGILDSFYAEYRKRSSYSGAYLALVTSVTILEIIMVSLLAFA